MIPLEYGNHISYTQVFALIFSACLEMDSITAASTMSKLAGSAGYLAILSSIVFVSLSCFCIVRVNQAFPGMTLVEYAPRLLGKFLGYGLVIGYTLFWLAQTVKSSRQMAALTSTYLLPQTPNVVIVTVAIVVTFYLVKGSINSVAKTLEILTPVAIIPGVLLLSLSFSNGDLSNLLPVFGKGIAGLAKGSILSGGDIQGIELLLMLMTYIDKPERVLPRALLGLTAVVIFAATGIASVIANFGAKETAQLVFPLVRDLRLIQLPGSGIFFVSIWWTAAFTTIGINLWVVSDCVHRISGKLISRKVAAYALSFLVIIACIVGSPLAFMKLVGIFNVISIGFVVVFPIGLYIVLRARRMAGT